MLLMSLMRSTPPFWMAAGDVERSRFVWYGVRPRFECYAGKTMFPTEAAHT
jgi:hypothetical protein